MNNWQPIDTAPKDGTKVWVYGCFDGAEKGFMATAHYCTQDDYGDGWIFVGMNPGTWKYKLTHWQPLPQPPEATKGSPMTHIKRSELTQLSEAYPIAIHHISETLGLTVPDFLAKVESGEIGRKLFLGEGLTSAV
jgi:hypothetical protein